MAKKILKITFSFFAFFFLFYLTVPGIDFPPPPPNSLQSQEPADTETPLRRAYFTNLSREEVLAHYQQNFQFSVFGFVIPNYRLNYPPEEAQSIIREQTRSSFLEEIVYPFRESLFVNGFKPSLEKDIIFIAGKKWEQKIIIRYVPSTVLARALVGVLTLFLMMVTFQMTSRTISLLRKTAKKKVGDNKGR